MNMNTESDGVGLQLVQTFLDMEHLQCFRGLRIHSMDCVPNLLLFFGLLTYAEATHIARLCPHGVSGDTWIDVICTARVTCDERVRFIETQFHTLTRAQKAARLREVAGYLSISHMAIGGVMKRDGSKHALILARTNDNDVMILDPQRQEAHKLFPWLTCNDDVARFYVAVYKKDVVEMDSETTI